MKGRENPNLTQAGGMKKQIWHRNLSTFPSAASEIADSHTKLTRSPSNGEKTKAEPVNASCLNRGTITHGCETLQSQYTPLLPIAILS